MLHEKFKAAASAVKSINKKGEGIFGNLIAFASENTSQGEKALREAFTAQEKAAAAEMKVEMGKNSTYKVVKNLLVNVVKAGITLTNPDGTFKGKTQLEDELAATKTPKSEAEKFKVAMNTATSIANKLTDQECITAAALAQDLLNLVAGRIKLAA